MHRQIHRHVHKVHKCGTNVGCKTCICHMGRHPYTHIDQYRHTDTRMPSRLPCDHKMDEERGREEGRVSARMREREWQRGLKEGKTVGGGGENMSKEGAREITTFERDRNTHAHSHTCSKALPPGAVNVKNIHSSPPEFLHHPYHCSCRRLLHTHTTTTKTHARNTHTCDNHVTPTHTHTHTHTHTRNHVTPTSIHTVQCAHA
jgi:hypothetical protein